MRPVTDPNLLRQLNAPVTDPALLAQLEGKRQVTPERMAQIDARAAADDQKLKDDLKEAGGYWANLGAGMDTAYRGIKQLVGKGDDDATIEERRKLKSQLAEGRVGGGLTQLVGEILPTLPVTMGVGGLVGKGVTKALPKAAELAMKGGRVANLGTVGRGVVEGATGGALAETTSDESKGFNAALGGVLGGVAPAVVGGASNLYKALNKSNAPTRAAKLMEKQLGKDGVQEVLDALHSPSNQSKLPLSTSAKSQNTQLAALERGARGRGDWTFNHDRKVAQTAWDTVEGATKNADELGQRIADREGMMAASKANLAMHDDPAALKSATQGISDAADAIRQSAAGRQIPEVTNHVGQIESMLSHPNRTAEDYATQWFRVNDLIKEGKLGPDANTALMRLRDAIHDAGNVASNGQDKFSDMLGRYMAEEGHVGQAQASKAIRETFMSPEGVIKTAREGLDSPHVDSGTLRRVMAAKGEGPHGDMLDPATRAQLTELTKDLGRHELHLPRNSPGSTALEIENPLTASMSGRDNVVNYFPGLKGSLNWAFGGSRKATTEAADKALMDPKAFEAITDALRKQRTPISTPQVGGPAFKPEDYSAILRRALLNAPGRLGVAEIGDN